MTMLQFNKTENHEIRTRSWKHLCLLLYFLCIYFLWYKACGHLQFTYILLWVYVNNLHCYQNGFEHSGPCRFTFVCYLIGSSECSVSKSQQVKQLVRHLVTTSLLLQQSTLEDQVKEVPSYTSVYMICCVPDNVVMDQGL